jgi:TonB-dependent starch-binding outer membrane protein SusC
LGGIPEIVSGVGGAQSHRTTVGESLGYFYGYKTDGIYKTDAEAAAAKKDASSTGAKAGDVRFVDVNNDGVIDSKDRTKLGSPIPGYFYGINGSAGWKSFDFSILLQGVGKMQVFNAGRAGLESMNDGGNQLASVADRRIIRRRLILTAQLSPHIRLFKTFGEQVPKHSANAVSFGQFL